MAFTAQERPGSLAVVGKIFRVETVWVWPQVFSVQCIEFQGPGIVLSARSGCKPFSGPPPPLALPGVTNVPYKRISP